MHQARARSGQFTIVASGIIAIILLGAVIATYAVVRNQPFQKTPNVAESINEMNTALQQILDATVGYYGSILQVSGNTTFAKQQASNYVQSGLTEIARTHPQWNPTIQLPSFSISTNWYGSQAQSIASVTATYSITSIGLTGYTVTIWSGMTANIQSITASNVRIQVLNEANQAEFGLTGSNFQFYSYSYANSSWFTKTSLGVSTIFSNGSYDVSMPSGIDLTGFFVQVTDNRGIMAVASNLNSYKYAFTWSNQYSTLSGDTMMIELLQNGTMRWLGQNLAMSPQGRPLPPIAVRAVRVNETIGTANIQVPFQVEDWASNFRVAMGMSNPQTIIGPRSMIVFLLTHKVSAVTIWWDGRDIANQTTYASQDKYFLGDNPSTGTLTNGQLSLNIGTFNIVATAGSSTTTANFFRVNGQASVYGAGASYVIYNGIVRDIIQQEAEFSGGVPNVPNLYTQITILLPANATYYTYYLRTIFVASTPTRTITDLSPIQVAIGTGSQKTENGTSGGSPIVSAATGNFYDQSWSGFTTGWMHHWSEFISAGGNGGGVMMTDQCNRNLYAFDRIANAKTGAINVISGSQTIEVDPVRIASTSFQYALDLAFVGAVVTFSGTPIYPNSGSTGLWIIAEYPPTIAVT